MTGGTAYALEGSNTVFSDDITNEQVRSADVANDSAPGALTGTDIRANSLTGSDINEASLAVPRGFTRAGTFASGGSLALTVPSVGSLTLNCANGGTPGDDSDDEIDFLITNQSGSTAIAGFGLHGRGGATLEDTASLPDTGGYSFNSSPAFYVDLVLTPTAGPGATFHASAEQIGSSDNCQGSIQAVRSG